MCLVVVFDSNFYHEPISRPVLLSVSAIHHFFGEPSSYQSGLGPAAGTAGCTIVDVAVVPKRSPLFVVPFSTVIHGPNPLSGRHTFSFLNVPVETNGCRLLNPFF